MGPWWGGGGRVGLGVGLAERRSGERLGEAEEEGALGGRRAEGWREVAAMVGDGTGGRLA